MPMIGVISDESERPAVEEFFQLFKTPWEFHQTGKDYAVLMTTRAAVPQGQSTLVISFASRGDIEDAIPGGPAEEAAPTILRHQGLEIPLYCGMIPPDGGSEPILFETDCGRVAGVSNGAPRPVIRLGYNLFRETEYLLTRGQPRLFSHIPTLERHIELVRDLVVSSGIPVVEIPPVPEGHRYLACLTHDIDFLRLRDHLFDRTMAGFLYRASLGSVVRLLQGRITAGNAMRNLAALLKLPLVHLGLCRDFWEQIPAYMEMEKDWKSTFFLIPFKAMPGTPCGDDHHCSRATKYDVADMCTVAEALVDREFEVAVHGIDAWENGQSAAAERNRLRECCGGPIAGIRMHWLYRNGSTFRILDEAGYSYDSSFGYNDAVGFRAGTVQAYKPLDSERLLELPLNLQDTALFYPDRMNLSEGQAAARCESLMENSRRYGGALTLLWHDRSLAPERLWGDFYRDLLAKLKGDRAWIGPAGRAVQWFQKRRKTDIEWVTTGVGAVEVRVNGPDPGEAEEGLPGLLLRVHYMPVTKGTASGSKQHKTCMDLPLKMNATTRIPLHGLTEVIS